jgi:hypothetical protein
LLRVLGISSIRMTSFSQKVTTMDEQRETVRKSFTLDANQHFHVDKLLLFTESDRGRHELCIKLLETIRSSISTFKPSYSLASLKSLDNLLSFTADNGDDLSFQSGSSVDNIVKSTLKRENPTKYHKAEIDIVISGGGLKGYFVTGCSHILKSELRKQNIGIRRVAGASAGAWCGLFMLTDFSTTNWIETYYLCQERLHLTMHEAYEVFYLLALPFLSSFSSRFPLPLIS